MMRAVNTTKSESIFSLFWPAINFYVHYTIAHLKDGSEVQVESQ